MFSTMNELQSHLKVLSGKHKLLCATEHKALITDIDDLIEILAALDEGDRLAMTELTSYLIAATYDLCYVLDLLPDAKKTSFTLCKLSLVKTTDDFIKIADHLNRDSLLQVAAQLANAKHYTARLGDISRIEKTKKFAFALSCNINSGEELFFSTENDYLSLDEVIALVENNPHIIEDGLSAALTLECLDPEDRLSFANKYISKIKSRFHYVMMQLKPEDRFQFSYDHINIISDVISLYVILDILDDDLRQLAFANKHSSMIKSASHLAIILSALNSAFQLIFATSHIDKIKNGDGLDEVMKNLDIQDQLIFANAYLKENPDIQIFLNILSIFKSQGRDSSYFLTFIDTHLHLITDVDHLIIILGILPQDISTLYAGKHAHLIKFQHELQTVAAFLPADSRAEFIQNHRFERHEHTRRSSAQSESARITSASVHTLFSKEAGADAPAKTEPRYNLRSRGGAK